MGYANVNTGYRGVIGVHMSVQCLGISVTKSLDSDGNTILEVRTPIVSRTTESVREYVGLNHTDAWGDGPPTTDSAAGLFRPWAIIDTSGSQPFVSYERQVTKKCEGGNAGLWTVTVTERTSVLV